MLVLLCTLRQSAAIHRVLVSPSTSGSADERTSAGPILTASEVPGHR